MMIKFFRKIRYNLINENKTSRYFKYAIGEIVLVVIGILIALQINNWNDYRKSASNSKDYLSEITKDLTLDTLELGRYIKRIESGLDAKEWALNKLTYSLKDLDSLQIAFSDSPFEFYINERTFQKLQNNSNSKLIGFDSLYNSISKYYTITNNFIGKVRDYEIKERDRHISFSQDKYMSVVELNYPFERDYDGVKVTKKFPLRLTNEEQDKIELKLYNTLEVRNQFREIYGTHLFLLESFKHCKETAVSILNQIDNSLEYD